MKANRIDGALENAAPVSAPAAGGTEKRSFAAVWREHHEKYLMILPFLAVFIIFTAAPVLMSIGLSFTSFNMVQFPKFVGLDNYLNLFLKDDVFLTAVKNTLIFAVVTGPISYILCFILAWLINELPRVFRVILTLVLYLPSISGNAYLIWKLIFSSDSYGFANAWLMKWGILSEPILWFQKAEYVMPILIVVQLWLSLGVSFLAFIAGLQGLDRSLLEAGYVEGIRNRWQELWYITLPSMKPMLMFGAVMQITSSLSVSNISLDLAGFPSVDYAGHTIMTHLYDYGNVRYEMGYACAIATVLFFLMVIINIIIQKLLRRIGS